MNNLEKNNIINVSNIFIGCVEYRKETILTHTKSTAKYNISAYNLLCDFGLCDDEMPVTEYELLNLNKKIIYSIFDFVVIVSLQSLGGLTYFSGSVVSYGGKDKSWINMEKYNEIIDDKDNETFVLCNHPNIYKPHNGFTSYNGFSCYDIDTDCGMFDEITSEILSFSTNYYSSGYRSKTFKSFKYVDYELEKVVTSIIIHIKKYEQKKNSQLIPIQG